MDSKIQFRDTSPPPNSVGAFISAVSDGSLSRRNSSIGLRRPMTARMILPRRRLIGPNPTEASEPLPVWRGTEISNPFPSSEESANFHSLEPEALTDPARQALRSTRLVDLFIALCTASDECNP